MQCFTFACPLVCSFQAVSDIERNEWLDAIRIAILKGLDEERHVERGSVPSSHNILERICQNASNRTCADCNSDSECVKGGVGREGRSGEGGEGWLCATHYTHTHVCTCHAVGIPLVCPCLPAAHSLTCPAPCPAPSLHTYHFVDRPCLEAQVRSVILKRDWIRAMTQGGQLL